MRYLFIETKYIYFKELDFYIDNLSKKFKCCNENKITTYLHRCSVQGMILPLPKILLRLLKGRKKKFIGGVYYILNDLSNTKLNVGLY